MPLTKIIDLKEVINIPGTDSTVYLSKDIYDSQSILIAQDGTTEKWYEVFGIVTTDLPIKKDYVFYILSPYPSPIQTN